MNWKKIRENKRKYKKLEGKSWKNKVRKNVEKK